jgi:sulfate/thiosulfate transport system permease protein
MSTLTLQPNIKPIPVRGHKKARLPGFGLSLGYTLLYLSLIVLIPLSTVFLKSFTMSWHHFWLVVSDPEAVAAYKLTLGASFAGAVINAVFGLLIAWVLVRYSFPGRKLLDGLIDLPFALPTAVAGITLDAIYSPYNGILGVFLMRHFHLQIAYTGLGVGLALTFIGLPFVVRSVQPVLEDFDTQIEEAASSLGANRFQTFTRVILPTIAPALITGFTLAFARAIGEYGSVIFISSNIPFKTEIVPQIIIEKLSEYHYPEAAAIALTMLVISFVLLFAINMLQLRYAKRFSN